MKDPIINNNQPGSITEAYPAPFTQTVPPAPTVETAITVVDIKKIFSNETKKLTLFIPQKLSRRSPDYSGSIDIEKIKYKLILYHNGKGLTEQCTGTLFIGEQKIKIKMNCNSFNEDPYLSQPAYKGKIHILDLVYYVALWKKSYLKQGINEIYYNGNITG
jgi:hypothetical protein